MINKLDDDKLKYWLGITLCLALLLTVQWRLSQPIQSFTLPVIADISSIKIDEPIQPIPLQVEGYNPKVKLGQQLFFDTSLSGDNQVSCSSCHDLQNGGADPAAVSHGFNGNRGTTNALGIFNSKYNIRLGWSGQFATFVDIIDRIMPNPKVMGLNWPDVTEKLRQMPHYRQAFGDLYTEGISKASIIDVLVAFLDSLTTPNSRFDKYLRGDQNALSPDEKAGYRLFKSYGCVSCHQGVNVGGNMFQRFGLVRNYFADLDRITPADLGRFNVTGAAQDRHVFRVPSLRNVALTAPYLHNGSVTSLEEAV